MVGLVFAVIVLVCVFAFAVIYFPDIQRRKAIAGFGSDWDCTAQVRGDPVCIKKPGR